MHTSRAICAATVHALKSCWRIVFVCAIGTLVPVATVTSLNAQTTGQLLAPSVVHELRLTIPALSRATLNAPVKSANGAWTSSIDAVTNVAIDVLLLPPLDGSAALETVRLRDVDGVLRNWADGPVLVARALTPGRHRIAIEWQNGAAIDSELGPFLAAGRSFTRPALTSGRPSGNQLGESGPSESVPDQRLLRIAP